MNTVVGDLEGNRARIVARLEEARAAGADLVLFPELAVTGYPPEDLLLRPGFLRADETLVGPTICEDIWQPGPPATDLALAGAHLVANISASPFHLGKGAEREEMLATRARDNSCWIAFVNAVGAQDELILDAHSLALDEPGRVVARGPSFEEALLLVDVDATTAIGRRLRDARRRALARARRELPEPAIVEIPVLDELEQMRLALELGLRDYVEKNGFRDVVLGVSGGIDSALTAALAAEALGPDRVLCVSMPSRYSSEETRADAKRVAETLGARYLEVAIEPIVEAVRAAPPEAVAGPEP